MVATTSEAGKDPRYINRPDWLLDPYSFYDFKQQFKGLGSSASVVGSVASWVPQTEFRRLRSYMLLESYYRTSARRWINTDNEDERAKRREYGDAYLIIEAVLSSLCGNDQKIAVDGAVNEENKEDSPEVQQQEMLEKWAEDEMLSVRFKECERNAVKLGDGVYVLGWDRKKKRPRLRVFDPGFYFPVLDPEEDDDFPKKVHVAFEFEKPTDKRDKELFVRRITWELRDVAPYRVPWEEDEVTQACFMSDMTWKIGDAKDKVDEFKPSTAQTPVRMDNVNLGIDFIPVVHIPNYAAGAEHYGTSTIASIMQLLDDVVATDTDLQSASALTGMPVIGFSGQVERDSEDNSKIKYGPGEAFELGADGKLAMLDTSRSLDALIKLIEQLLDRLSVNARTPGTLLGRVDPAQVQAGVILTLSFAPHTTMIREMRDIRKIQYRLLLKMVGRFFWKEGKLSALKRADLKLGSYLPADKAEAIGMITNGLNSHSMSMETAVMTLIEAGFPIEDIQVEIERIMKRNYDAALKIHDATENPQFAADVLELGVIPEEHLTLPGADRDLAQEQLDLAQQAQEDKAKADEIAAKNQKPVVTPPK